MFLQNEIDRIVAETFVEHVEQHHELESTSTRALELSRLKTDEHACTLVVADQQTAGRGRGGNFWWSSQGALTFSVLLNRQGDCLPADRWPMVSLAAGLAVAEAIDLVLDGPSTALKWPNDVFLQGRKVSGILVESADHRMGDLVIGIGVNANNAIQDSPEEIHSSAIAICDLSRQQVALIELLIYVLKSLETHLACLGSTPEEVSRHWQSRCLLTDASICIHTGHRQLEGVCRGIDSEGALLVETDLGTERCLSGVVTRFD